MGKIVELEVAGLMDPTHATGQQHPLTTIDISLLRKCVNRARASRTKTDHSLAHLDWGQVACACTGARQTGLADGERRHWLRADLVELQADTHALYVMGNRHLNLAQEELGTVAESINELLRPLDMQWFPISSQEGYLSVNQTPEVRFVPLLKALLGDRGRALPTGRERGDWERLTTELQMLLHTHPVNRERQERGSAPANSLYVWGAMEQPPSIDMGEEDMLISDSNMVLGAAPPKARTAILSNWLSVDMEATSRAIVVITELMWLRRQGLVAEWQQRVLEFQRHWLAPVISSLEKGEIEEVSMYFGGNWRFVLTKRYWRRFWRWNRPIGEWLNT